MNKEVKNALKHCLDCEPCSECRYIDSNCIRSMIRDAYNVIVEQESNIDSLENEIYYLKTVIHILENERDEI